MQDKESVDVSKASLGDFLNFLNDLDKEIGFDFYKDYHVFKRSHPNTISSIKAITGNNKEKFAEFLLENPTFKKERNTYHWNLFSVLQSSKKIDEKSLLELTKRLLKSPTLLLSNDQKEAIAFLTGLGDLDYSRREGKNKIPNYRANNFLAKNLS